MIERYYIDGVETDKSIALNHGTYSMVVLNDDGVVFLECSFVDSKKHGIEKGYYMDGKLFYESSYENGLQKGDNIIYNENGDRAS